MTIAEEIRADREKGAERLEREYRDRLHAVAVRLGADTAEAEALVYRTIEEAVRVIGSYEERSAFFPWLGRIMANCRAKDVRRRSSETVRFVAELPEPSAPEVEADGGERVAEAVDAGLLRDAIDALPADMREAVVLRYFMDQPVGKMAKLLSLPVGTVKSRLYYARVLLGRLLGANLGRTAAAVLVLLLAALGAWAAVRLLSPTYYWRPGDRLSRYDDPANWSTEGPDGPPAAEPPGADATLYGGGDYAFDIAGRGERTLLGLDAPDDWRDHTLVVANGSLCFRGEVATHTGEMTVEAGGTVTLLEGSAYVPALNSAGKWVTRVKAGGAFNLLGDFRGYSYRILVEPGGTATINPQSWGGSEMSAQGENAVENFGTLNLPRGLSWTQGGRTAVTYSAVVRQCAGVMNLGGPVAKAPDIRDRLTLVVELLGGTVNVSGEVSFAADVARLGSGVRFALAKGAVLDLSTFAVADGAELAFTGEGRVVLPAGNYGKVSADASVALVPAEAARRPGAVVLCGGEELVVSNDTVWADGFAARSGPNGELPSLVVAAGATLTVPGGTRFGNMRMVVRGTVAAADAGDLVFGYAAAGTTAPFALTVDGGTLSNAFGSIDFLCPTFGGRVTAAEPLVLRRATLWTRPPHGFDFGVNNPEDIAATVAVEGTTLTYGAGTHTVAGGVTLAFSDGARLYKADSEGAKEEASLIVSQRGRLVFGPGTDLHYGASALRGSAGNGGLSFLPSEDGFAALVLDGATFWIHHPNNVRGPARATMRVRDATYESRAMSWNYRMPFSGFRAVDVTGTLTFASTPGTGDFAWDGSDDPRRLRPPRGTALTGAGTIRLVRCAGDDKPFCFRRVDGQVTGWRE